MLVWSARFSCALVLVLTVGAAGPARAQPTQDVKVLNAEAFRLYKASKYPEATEAAKRALEISEKALGSDHPSTVESLNNLAFLYKAQYRYDDAEPLYKRALAIIEKVLGPDDLNTARALNNLAVLNREQARYDDAEPLYRRALVIKEKALGSDHLGTVESLNNLALLYQSQGRYGDAEPLYKRALVIKEKALGSDDPDTASSLGNLALLYQAQGRYDDAEPFYKRALEIKEKVWGRDHLNTASSLGNLALLYQAQGRYDDAEPLQKRALAIKEKALGSDHLDIAQSLNNLASLYFEQGRYAQAEPLHKRALEITEKTFGPGHRWTATPLNNLATLYVKQGRFAQAEPLLKQTLTILEKALGPDHPDTALFLNNLAGLYFAQNDWRSAVTYFRRGTDIIARRSLRGTQILGRGLTGKTKSEAVRSGLVFPAFVKATYRLAREDDAAALQDEAFKAAQWAVGSEAAAALAQMAARGAKDDLVLTAVVRERQDRVNEWQNLDARLIQSRSQPPAKRNTKVEVELAGKLAAIDKRIMEIDARLKKDFPDYTSLVSPEPIGIREIRSQLSDNEALVLILDTPEWEKTSEETFIWIVTKQKVQWLRSDLGTTALKIEVAALRCGLDATAWDGEGKSRCADLLKLPVDKAPKKGEALPFDVSRAYSLFDSLFGSVRDLIAGKHLLIVPSGALTTLPIQVLITEPPHSIDPKSAHWLTRDHAITVLPSVGSLTALRRTGRPSAAPEPMIGFANPLLHGDQQHLIHGEWFRQQAQRAREETGCAATPRQRTAALRGPRFSLSPVPQVEGLADLGHLRVQTPLPETADEVCEVARIIGADTGEIRVGARATETEVKRLSEARKLVSYRIVHFATHGLLAGQLDGTREPGLILTPPATATLQDDGYLSASEIAGLKLDADWVILSACNTAGGAGEGQAAEALSGLARVFFYAGARALLVSHWEVDSDAAVKLVTNTVRVLTNNKSVGRAEALRQAMLSVMADATRPENWVPAWHPAVWAPFVVVGEGGASR